MGSYSTKIPSFSTFSTTFLQKREKAPASQAGAF